MKAKEKLSVHYYGDSDLGLVRSENQDSFGKFPLDSNDLYREKGLLFIVADGMGGHVGGKEASQLAVKTVNHEYFSFRSELISNCLKYAFKNANAKIFHSSKGDMQFRRMGTTCSALVLRGEFAYLAHVGDSRIYRIAGGDIEQLTNDHTQVAEMLKKQIISEDEAKEHPGKSVLVRALGIESDIDVDLKENIQLECDQIFVLCSDGLAKVQQKEIKEIVLSNTPSEACKKLIKIANERGGHDNITVQVIKVTENGRKMVNKDKVANYKSSRNWIKIGIISALMLIILLLGIFFLKDISELFSNKTNFNNMPLEAKKTESDQSSQILLGKADYWLKIGQLDSALVAYKLILVDNQMHVGALNGIDMISQQYVDLGKKYMEQEKYEYALVYYRKAEALKSNDQSIKSLILFCDKKIFALDNQKQNNTGNYISTENELEEESDKQSVIDNIKNLNAQIDYLKINKMEWNFNGLDDEDYNLYGDGIAFTSTNKGKMIIHEKLLEDVDINVEVKIQSNRIADRAGIVIGYLNDQQNNEAYFLFTIERSGNFSLRKITGNNEEQLLLIKKPIGNTDKFLIKVKCLGPWIMVFNDNKLLDSWLSKDFIKGQMGLYAEGKTYAEFSKLNINSAFEKK